MTLKTCHYHNFYGLKVLRAARIREQKYRSFHQLISNSRNNISHYVNYFCVNKPHRDLLRDVLFIGKISAQSVRWHTSRVIMTCYLTPSLATGRTNKSICVATALSCAPMRDELKPAEAKYIERRQGERAGKEKRQGKREERKEEMGMR